MEEKQQSEIRVNAKNKEIKEKPGCGKHEPLINPINRKQFRFSIWYFLGMLVFLFWLNSIMNQPHDVMLDFSDFKQKIADGGIRRVEIGDKFYLGYPLTRTEMEEINLAPKQESRQKDSLKIYRAVKMDDPGFVPLLDGKKVEYYARPQDDKFLETLILTWIIPLGLMLLVWRFVSKKLGNVGQGVMSFGENRAKLVAEGDTGVTFGDVAGADEAKAELVEVVDFLKEPEKYETIGGKIPKGVLLVGPPGTGKTLLAKAVAGEAQVPFFKISGADFVEMFVGVGAARVRDLFKQARQKAPCIIFIDELDAIGKSRSVAIGGNDEREQTLNQLLVEMDGFDSTTGVIILAATNRPEILDPALLRPGRFDRQVLVDRPDVNGREAILKIHAKNVKLDAAVDLKKVAQGTPGFSGADLANIVNEAALLAVRDQRTVVLQKDFDNAIEKIIAGLEKKNRLIHPREREIVACHETGHALIATFTEGADPVHKISIVPRGMGALGYTIQLPTEDRFLLTEDELLGKIDVLLGGRASEELMFGKISTGAANDISRATDIARRMITEYGMSSKFKNIALPFQKQALFLSGQTGASQREYSEATQQYIDEEITRIVNARYEKVKQFLKNKQVLLRKISVKLLEVEILDEAQFQALIAEESN